jgi:hypothetical protein
MYSDARGAPDSIRQERRAVTAEDLAAAGIDPALHPGAHTLADLRQYPVLSEGGWFLVIKNQATQEELARWPWRLFGPVELLSSSLVLD